MTAYTMSSRSWSTSLPRSAVIFDVSSRNTVRIRHP